MTTIYAPTFEMAFKQACIQATSHPEHVSETRIGKAYELFNLLVEVENPETYQFEDSRINRIDYAYAEKFWEFMISGGTDAEEAFKNYPNVAKFLTKPKSKELPDNFNTFYGPRIAAQLPGLIDELVRSPTSRRAVLLILDAGDQALLDKDETLEYPCTISFSFQLRDGELFMHTVMRSQNLATVFQLDIYCQGLLLELVKERLENWGLTINKTHWTCYIQNAHVFERDIPYVESFTGA